MFFLKIILNWISSVVGGKDNAIILASFLSFVATLILVIVTNKYVKLTKTIADDNSKYLKITEKVIAVEKGIGRNCDIFWFIAAIARELSCNSLLADNCNVFINESCISGKCVAIILDACSYEIIEPIFKTWNKGIRIYQINPDIDETIEI